MNKYLVLVITIINFVCPTLKSYGQDNYRYYHKEIIRCEQLIIEGKYKDAVQGFDSLFRQYDFAFKRDIKVATQLSAFVGDVQSGFNFIRMGILSGWTLKSINKTSKMRLFQEDPAWKKLLTEYDSLHTAHLSRINIQVNDHVRKMFVSDQKMALGALLRVGQKAKIKYAEKKFASHSEKQLMQLKQILDQNGYPGEQLIGNDLWGMVILSHHNSISVPYNSIDTLYNQLIPKLINALEKGEISPYEFAVIADWKIAVLNGHRATSYGILGRISNSETLEMVNQNRADIGMRSTYLRNDLIEVEQATGLNFYLPNYWSKEKITVDNKD